MLYLLLPLAAYLIGSVSSAILVSRLMGLPDPRTEGSRNPGATNVLRLGSKTGAALGLPAIFSRPLFGPARAGGELTIRRVVAEIESWCTPHRGVHQLTQVSRRLPLSLTVG